MGFDGSLYITDTGIVSHSDDKKEHTVQSGEADI